MSTEFIKTSIANLREKLLDLSKRNNLVSFKHSEGSRQHIRIVDELPNILFSKFLNEEKLTFKSLPQESGGASCEEGQISELWEGQEAVSEKEIAKKYGINPGYVLPTHGEAKKSHEDKFIQTLLKPEAMDKKLHGLHSLIRLDIEETGVNTLYGAFGFLEWYEADHSDQPLYAPLLLLQLEIEKEKKSSKARCDYKIQSTGDKPEINLNLSERLKKDFGFQLPSFAEGDNPEKYMDKIAQLAKEINGKWRVHRFFTIGRFSFARLVMFNDLNENGKYLYENKIIQSLFSGSDDNSSTGEHAEDYDIDSPNIEHIAWPLITQADASQHSAIVDVMNEKNLVIEGPPGTGKSQTITNMIACALRKKKAVLFLAEKMAALNVVHDRLKKAGLAPYCLELHSTKAKKIEVLKSIKDRLDIKSNNHPIIEEADFQAKNKEFNSHRDRIKKYVDVMNSSFGKQNKSVHEHLWSFQRAKTKIAQVLRYFDECNIPFEQANLTKSDLSDHVNALNIIAGLKKEIDEAGGEDNHPWYFIKNDSSLLAPQKEEIKNLAKKWKNNLEEMHKELQIFAQLFHSPAIYTSRKLDVFLNETEALVSHNIECLDEKLIASLENIEGAEALLKLAECISNYNLAIANIKSLQNIPESMSQFEDIKSLAIVANKLKVDGFSQEEILLHIEEINKEIKLWDKKLDIILEIGGRFGNYSKDDNMKKIHALTKIPEYIEGIPRHHLEIKTEKIIDESNSEKLKEAVCLKNEFDNSIKIQEKHYDLSVCGGQQEMRDHADAIKNPRMFLPLFFDPSYRKARKFFKLICKTKRKFDANEALRTFMNIANIRKMQQEIEDDQSLKEICGSFFKETKTDFQKLQETNEWAAHIRSRPSSLDEFPADMYEWIFKANIKELDYFKSLADDEEFVELTNKIDQISNTVPSPSINEHLNQLGQNIKALDDLGEMLKKIGKDSSTKFADICNDIPYLQKARRHKEEAHKIMELFKACHKSNAHLPHIDTNIESVEETRCFISELLSATKATSIDAEAFLNNQFAQKWSQFVADRLKIKNLHDSIKENAENIQERSPMFMSTEHGSGDWKDVLFENLVALLMKSLGKNESLNSWVDFWGRVSEAKKDVKGLLLSIYIENKLDFNSLAPSFEYVIYKSIVLTICNEHPGLMEVKGMELNQSREKLQELEKEILQLGQRYLHSSLSKEQPLPGNPGALPKKEWTEERALHLYANQQRPRVTIRDLMKRAGKSIQKVKPCFLMSPLSVAQFLELGKMDFDLVIIDEASQMRPEDALGSIARSKQIAIVGDKQQLPPTSFFNLSAQDDDAQEEIDDAIIDMASNAFRPSRTLKVHYRSEHENLIAFSNYHFYNNKLTIFPSSHIAQNVNNQGIRLEKIKGIYKNRSNEKEADEVIKKALAFMEKHPDRSLGIVAMNEPQQRLINEKIFYEILKSESAQKYENKWKATLEPFFVKNLENVQGDERDTIFISTVYGPERSGARVMQRFGPINSMIGHRRLNVLFTRAKKNMVLFTSLAPNDIVVSEKSKKGVRIFKDFLAYVSNGCKLDESRETHREPDSDFEIWVKESLENIGYEVVPQVGVAGYRIDLGIKHPELAKYILGIECDGATYHAPQSARERDIIRQQVLENMGWNIYRIWSTDWFDSPQRELAKLKSRVEELMSQMIG